jgi:hypothetical protein
MDILSHYSQKQSYDFPLKTYTLAGYEPGSSVPEAVGVSTAPRRLTYICMYVLHTSAPMDFKNTCSFQNFKNPYISTSAPADLKNTFFSSKP